MDRATAPINTTPDTGRGICDSGCPLLEPAWSSVPSSAGQLAHIDCQCTLYTGGLGPGPLSRESSFQILPLSGGFRGRGARSRPMFRLVPNLDTTQFSDACDSFLSFPQTFLTPACLIPLAVSVASPKNNYSLCTRVVCPFLPQLPRPRAAETRYKRSSSASLPTARIGSAPRRPRTAPQVPIPITTRSTEHPKHRPSRCAASSPATSELSQPASDLREARAHACLCAVPLDRWRGNFLPRYRALPIPSRQHFFQSEAHALTRRQPPRRGQVQVDCSEAFQGVCYLPNWNPDLQNGRHN